MKFKLFKSRVDGLFYFHLQSGNNKIIMASEGYNQKQKARKTLDKINTEFSSPATVVDTTV